MRAYSKAMLWITLTLLVGIALGAAGTLLTVRGRIEAADSSPPANRVSRAEAEERFVKRMVDDLKLDEAQEQQVRTILNEGRTRFRAAEKQKDSEVRSVINEMNDQIRALLRPEQQQSFEEFLEQLRKRHRRKDPRPPNSENPES